MEKPELCGKRLALKVYHNEKAFLGELSGKLLAPKVSHNTLRILRVKLQGPKFVTIRSEYTVPNFGVQSLP